MSRTRLYLALALLVVALTLPVVAQASPYSWEQTITASGGMPIYTLGKSDTAGDWVAFESRLTIGGAHQTIDVYDIRTAQITVVGTSTADCTDPIVTGDWVVWYDAADFGIRARNMKTGERRTIPETGPTNALCGDHQGHIAFSEFNGHMDIYVYDFATGSKTFAVSGSDGDEKVSSLVEGYVGFTRDNGAFNVGFARPGVAPTMFTSDGQGNRDPLLTTERIVWFVQSTQKLWVGERDGGGAYMLDFGAGMTPESWHADGEYLVVSVRSATNVRSLVLVDLRDNWHLTLAAGVGTSDLKPHIGGDTISYKNGADIVLVHLIVPTLTSNVALQGPTTVAVTGTLKQAGHAIATEHNRIILQTKNSQDNWSNFQVGDTDAAGAYSFSVPAMTRTTYRVVYYGMQAAPTPAENHFSRVGEEATVYPLVSLSAPALLKPSPKRNKSVNLWGSIMPEQPAGTTVKVELWRKVGKKYVLKKKATAPTTSAPGASRYSVNVKFPNAGTWRVRALMAQTATNGATTSVWRTIKVK